MKARDATKVMLFVIIDPPKLEAILKMAGPAKSIIIITQGGGGEGDTAEGTDREGEG